MNVNFNNLRRQCVNRYNDLCKKLNDATIKETENREFVDNYGWIGKGTIIIDAEDIQSDMDDLRMLIGSIAMVYEEGSKEFANIYEEMFPENTDKTMASFNEENDD